MLSSFTARDILKLILSSPLLQSPFHFCHEQFGWHTQHGQTEITWDSEDAMSEEPVSQRRRQDFDKEGAEVYACEILTTPTSRAAPRGMYVRTYGYDMGWRGAARSNA